MENFKVINVTLLSFFKNFLIPNFGKSFSIAVDDEFFKSLKPKTVKLKKKFFSDVS